MSSVKKVLWKDFHFIGEVWHLKVFTLKAELTEICAQNDGKIPSFPSGHVVHNCRPYKL